MARKKKKSFSKEKAPRTFVSDEARALLGKSSQHRVKTKYSKQNRHAWKQVNGRPHNVDGRSSF